MKSTRKKGDEAEQFVADYLRELGYVVEIHPRTFRLIRLPNGKTVQVSHDNDYHNAFDIKAEGIESMIYAQVKYEEEKVNSTTAQHTIEKNYPYAFPYVRVQIWQVWKEWVKEPHRHKEFRFRAWERQGYTEVMNKGIHKFIPVWNEITPEIEVKA